MADTHMNNASWEFVDSFHETNQAVADHYVAVQDRNLHVAQNLFLMGAEAMESQTKTTRHLLNQWTQELSKQQKAFHTLVNATLNVYLECLRLPFSLYRVGMDVSKTEMQQALQFAHHATPQTIEAANEASPHQEAQLWTFEHPLQEADNQRPVLIRVKGPGMVHAGVNRAGTWIRMYDEILREVAPGVWEASLVDPEVNEFTFIWSAPSRTGEVHWEGKNYLVPRHPVSKADSEWSMEKSIEHVLDQTEIV